MCFLGFAGLKDFTLEFTTIIDPDLKAESTVGKSFTLTRDIEEKLNRVNGIAAYSKIIEERVIASFDGNKQACFLKGVDENYATVYKVDSIVELGSWLTKNTSQVVVGWGVSRSLNIGVLDYGKRLSLYVPKPGKGQITSVQQAFNQTDAINVGVFSVNEKFDDTYIFSSIGLAQDLLSLPNGQFSSIEFRLTENADETLIKEELQTILGNQIVLKNKEELNESLHKMLNTENLFVYLLLTLVSIILIFNVIGSLIMMILDKKQTLSTLYNIGATLKDIRKIFFLQGTIMTTLGTLIGLFIGYLIVMMQQAFSLVMITPSLGLSRCCSCTKLCYRLFNDYHFRHYGL
ncbi:ABC transporter permease [Lacinutrix neustonica]|uniref:ABC transporter permease n=1 Tax=Lacinutrix neustonica TaxID=2980107 RepID=UPI0028BED6F4|nr:FtsX-like permease family protein [Lacinutrix neustonica]